MKDLAPQTSGIPNKKVHAGHFAIRLERSCVASLLLSMMSQVNGYIAMPSYNALLAGWGLFSAYSRSGRAVFGLLFFLGVSIILDIVFLSIWSSGDADILSRDDDSAATSTTAFSVAMLCMNLFIKVAIMYYAGHLFAVLSPPTSQNRNQHYAYSAHSRKKQLQRAAEAGESSPRSSPRRSLVLSESRSSPLHTPTTSGVERTEGASNSDSEYKSDNEDSRTARTAGTPAVVPPLNL